MAPTNPSRRQRADFNLDRVYAGRIETSRSKRGYTNKNQGKELIKTVDNSHKELFPDTRVEGRESTTGISFRDRSPLSLKQTENTASVASLQDQITWSATTNSPKLNLKRHQSNSKSKKAALRTANPEQRKAQLIRDGTAERMRALQFQPDHVVHDARNATTITYASGRLDLDSSISLPLSNKLKFSITIGFWGYAPVISPVKIFLLSEGHISSDDHLSKLVLANGDVKKAVASIGVNIDDVVPVGFEMMFPKGYRYIREKGLDHTEDYFNLLRIIQSDEHVLVNTSCAMKEYFWQATRYASDDDGNVLVQIVMRIAIVQAQSGGESILTMINTQWRNSEEKQYEAREKKRLLERQSFASGSERRMLKEKMKGIEERSQRAMDMAKAQKDAANKSQTTMSESTVSDTLTPMLYASHNDAATNYDMDDMDM